MTAASALTPNRPGAAFAWTLNLLRHVMRHAGEVTIISVVLFLLSQAALLLALVLPWQILARLAAADAAPAARLPDTLPLAALALGCFVLHLAADAFAASLSQRMADRLLDRQDKLNISTALRQQSTYELQRLLRCTSCGVAALVAAVVTGLLYPRLLPGLLLYSMIGLVLVTNGPSALTRRLHEDIRGKLWWGAGFTLLLAQVVADHARGQLPALQVVFAALLLGRMVLMFQLQALRALMQLWSRQRLIAACFLPQPLPDAGIFGSRALSHLMSEPERDIWLADVLRPLGLTGFQPDPADLRWSDRGRIASLLLQDAEQTLLLRIFDPALSALAQSEAALLQAVSGLTPAPHFLAQSSADGFQVLVSHCPPGTLWHNARPVRGETLALRGALMGAEIGAALADRYQRSHPSLPDRLLDLDLRLLSAMARSPHERSQCDALADLRPALVRLLQALPGQIVLPKLTARRMAVTPAGAQMICNWSLWRWEPLGADWPWRARSAQELHQALAAAALRRADIDIEHCAAALLSAQLAEFVESAGDGQVTEALDLLPQILRSAQSTLPAAPAETAPTSAMQQPVPSINSYA